MTGLAASAAENLGAQAQSLESFLRIEDSQGFTAYHIFLAFLLGMFTGILLMGYFQFGLSPILSLIRRLSGFLRYT